MSLFLSACATTQGPVTTAPDHQAEPPKPIGSGRGKMTQLPKGILAGSQLTPELDDKLTIRDRHLMMRIVQSALADTPAGEKRAWENPNSGFQGAVIPQPAFADASGATCREYQQTVWVKGTRQTAYETACSHTDGTWRILSQ